MMTQAAQFIIADYQLNSLIWQMYLISA